MHILNIRMGLGLLAMALSLPAWAANLGAPGVPNFHQVNEHVFRGGQPTAEGWHSLAKLGVRTVIDLRRTDEHSPEAEAQLVAEAGMKYVNVPMKGIVAPTDQQINMILSHLDSKELVFVHCKRGADRTGAVIACYRMAHDHWGRKQALQEAKSLGMGWTQMGLKSYVNSFQPTATKSAAADRQPTATKTAETSGL